MAEKKYLPPKNLVNPYIKDFGEYNGMYQESIEDPQAFFHKQALDNLDWIEPFKSVHNEKFVDSKWFEDGKINVAHNCIDRHLELHANKTALIWEEMILMNHRKLVIKSYIKMYLNLETF